MVHIYMTIRQNDPENFENHSQLLDYLRNKLLPICASSRGYEFVIWFFNSDKDDNGTGTADIISSVLQFPQIVSCSNVELNPCQLKSTALPVEAISNWLHRNYLDGHGLENRRERCLQISVQNIINGLEMCQNLKKVSIFSIFFNFFYYEIIENYF